MFSRVDKIISEEMEKALHNGESEPLKFQENAGNVGSSAKPMGAVAFEEVLDSIGSRGKFQMRLNVVFICIAVCFNLFSVNSFYLAMQTPDHWCHVPGGEETNMSLEEWKNITIPREGDSFSKCLMYNQSDTGNFSSGPGRIHCQNGWDYDDTWFSMTAPSQMNWVCDNQHVVKDVLFYSQNTGVVLGLLFGYIGDMYGRRPQQFLCLAAHIVSRLLIVFAPHILFLFILGDSLVAAASGPMIESALSVGLELTDIKHRICINRYASCSIAGGMIMAGLLAWALPDWNYFMSTAALSWVAILFFFRWFPESPRWLACRGREEEALQVLRRIASTNGSTVPPFASQVIHTVGKSKADRTGFLSIFSSWNVFKNTGILAIARSVFLLTIFTLVLSMSRLSVNPFLTLAAQGAAKLAAMYGANSCAANFGRRWTAVAAPLMAAVASAVIFCLLYVNVTGAAIVVMTMFMQFSSTGSIAMTNLQSVEVHPTCLRQISASVEWTVAGFVLSALPYLALMNDKRLPFAILTGLNVVSAVSVSFLPETSLQRLPETLQDGAVFGKGQPYWSWKPKPPPEYASE